MGLPQPAPAAEPVHTVSSLTTELQGCLARGFGNVCVRGEVSQWRPVGSGHVYFTLKDDGAVLPCVMWRSAVARLRFRVEEGHEVLVRGGIDVYPPHGRYQLLARTLEPLGSGALQIAFEQMRRRLEAEGLFATARKRRLPASPRRIVLVTSPTGAAVRDLVTVIHRRYPPATILLVAVRVQGEGAAAEIAAGLAFADRAARADVIVVGRGGGSLEDLWAFNEEVVARAIFACRTPVVSAVGHETDVTISDLVADVRAATPSQAGELVVPARDDLLGRLAGAQGRLAHAMRVRIDGAWQRLEAVAGRAALRDGGAVVLDRARHLGHLAERLRARNPVAELRRRVQAVADLSCRLAPPLRRRAAAARERAAVLAGRATAAARLTTERARTSLAAVEGRLRALSPLAVLARGYSITVRDDGRAVRGAGDVAPGERVTTQLGDGARLRSRVEAVERPASPPPP